MIKYEVPRKWILYNHEDVHRQLVDAESAILALRAIPYQREWVENIQKMELKREVAGTSRIEGAEFTERELDDALQESPEQLITRSQKQAHAALQTYRWIATIPDDRPIDGELIKEIHRRIVTGADDDHCAPGRLRGLDENVTFGSPRHRGVSGGEECRDAYEKFIAAIQHEYRNYDHIIQGIAAHYHFAAMHPFLDGNGRTARAIEALFLQRAGLRDVCFISMSNYYYDEKINYLASLADSRAQSHNITPFLLFALKGIAIQAKRLLGEIRIHVRKALFKNMMHDLFGRLKTPRKRVIADRQLRILGILLKENSLELLNLYGRVEIHYKGLKNPTMAFIRDIFALKEIGAIDGIKTSDDIWTFNVRLDWPTEITETEFMKRIKILPKAKTLSFHI